MRDLLVATTNPGKIREIRLALEAAPLQLLTLADWRGDVDPPQETGRTFSENAALKARYYADATGVATVAEDSGLVVDALGGRPGVESARYPGATYADRFASLYRELAPHPRPWTARFVCALAFVDQVPVIGRGQVRFACEASVEGEIAPAPRGSGGFGYDPIFLVHPLNSLPDRTLGEATDDEKLAVSHRGKAFRQFREWLQRSWKSWS